MAMAERQQLHRQDLEKEVVHSNSTNQRWGLILGFVLAMSVAAGGFWLLDVGKDGFGIAAVISSIGTPGAIFVWGRIKQKKERSEKITPK